MSYEWQMDKRAGQFKLRPAEIIIEDFDANEVITKAELQKKWDELGMSKKFMYMAGAMMKGDLDISRR
jgi:hypothetical protein